MDYSTIWKLNTHLITRINSGWPHAPRFIDAIKNRKKANDVFITPLELSKVHIDFIPDKYKWSTSDMWLDPCKNSGSYFDQFPEGVDKNWCEILDDIDFFDYVGDYEPQPLHDKCNYI